MNVLLIIGKLERCCFIQGNSEHVHNTVVVFDGSGPPLLEEEEEQAGNCTLRDTEYPFHFRIVSSLAVNKE